MKTYTDLMDAYREFEKKKNWKTLKNLYRNAFNGGLPVWKIYRFIKNLVTGRYKRLYEKY